MQVNRQIFVTTLLLLISILLFGMSHLDIEIQNLFYNYKSAIWILPKHSEPYHFLFYDLARKIPLLLLLAILILLLFFKKKSWVQTYKKGLIIVMLSIIFVPSITVGIKNNSNMPCPKHLIEYGGSYPHTSVWEKYSAPYNTLKSQHCWPAGHASGGFALLSLFFLLRKPRHKRLALTLALIAGWSMGSYKMLIGDHFFSHTLITMLLSWLIILVIVKLIDRWLPLHKLSDT